ncbi:MAG: hypothetical protein A2139_10515 [Desulfobacca sp. RBG_16_60_12]|nr:MAG: hypothetical protein A2139_10515 [Desulfobacca sp. RBG_16_60_12]
MRYAFPPYGLFQMGRNTSFAQKSIDIMDMPVAKRSLASNMRPQAGAWGREEGFSKLLKSVGRVSRAIFGA